jgi:hypothetical protein
MLWIDNKHEPLVRCKTDVHRTESKIHIGMNGKIINVFKISKFYILLHFERRAKLVASTET